MKKLLTLVIAVIIGTSMTFAQGIESEIQAGINLSSISKYDSKTGFNVGFRGTIPLQSADGTYFNIGALLTLKGAEKDYGYELDAKINAYYLEIPVHFGYRHAVSESATLFGEFGPYLGIGLFGKAKVSSMGDSAKVDTFSDEGGAKRFDFGLGFRAGIEINQKIPISVGYDLGLLNINKDEDPSLKSSNFTVAIGYKF